MKLPRYALSTLLALIALIAVWLATFRFDYYGDAQVGTDIRRAVRLVILIVSVSSVVYCREKERAFWIGFLVAYAVNINRGLAEYLDGIIPTLSWIDRNIENRSSNGVRATLYLAYALTLGVIGGRLSMIVYHRNRRRSE